MIGLGFAPRPFLMTLESLDLHFEACFAYSVQLQSLAGKLSHQPIASKPSFSHRSSELIAKPNRALEAGEAIYKIESLDHAASDGRILLST
jgi:hypothetical protein